MRKLKRIINENFIAIVFIIIITLCTNIFSRYLYKEYYINNKVEINKKWKNDIIAYVK